MTRFFSDEDIDKLTVGQSETRQQFIELRELFTNRTYKSNRGREFALHGFCRHDATIAIHSFVLNAFGCLDNLAWVWVCEKPVLDQKGNKLGPLQVGLGPKCTSVRKSFSNEFVSYLESRQVWVDKHLKGFRDSLAHRIPLYIPPYIVSPNSLEKYNKLEKDSFDALRRGDIDNYKKLLEAQKSLCFWRPWMTHSFTEESPQAIFHVQLLNDYLTIDEFGRKMLEELDRQGL
jgi:hypothetical protein